MSDKIKMQHLERKTILYVRQSSAYQLLGSSWSFEERRQPRGVHPW